jgi:hypothetical protein
MSVSPWYVPGSLRNLEPADGNVAGFRFAYRVAEFRTMYYVTHRMALFLDGAELKNPNLWLTYKGVTVRAAQLPETNWVCLRGDLVEVAADFPGGLRQGRHQVRLEAVFGGGFGGGAPAASVRLCDFTGEIA